MAVDLDRHEHLEKVRRGELASMHSWELVTRVEVLPFHQMGRDKWATLGLPYQLEDTQPPSADLLERVRGQFSARGITTY